MKKTSQKRKISVSGVNERMIGKIRNVSEQYGISKPEFTIHTPSPDGKIHYNFFYSAKMPPIDFGPNKQSLEVEVSSAEQDNDNLLHLLLS